MTNTKYHLLAIFSILLSKLADQILLFAIPIIVFKLTNSFSLSGIAFFMEWLPRVISLPISGRKLDKCDSQNMFVHANFVRGVIILCAFLALSLTSVSLFLVLCLMMVINGFYYARSFVTVQYYTSHVYSGKKLAKVQTYLMNIEQISQIMGPAIGVALSVYFNILSELIIIAVMFVLSSLFILRLPKSYFIATNKQNVIQSNIVKDLQVALGVIWYSNKLRWMVTLTIFINLIWGLMLSMGAPLVTGTFQLTASYFGLVQTVTGIVNIAIFMLIPIVLKRCSVAILGFSATIGMITGGLLIGAGQTYTFFFIGYLFIMVFDGVFNVYIRTERAKFIPKDVLGKTIGMIVFLNQLSVPLAGLLMSILATLLSPFAIIIVFCILTILTFILSLPQLFQRHELVNNPNT